MDDILQTTVDEVRGLFEADRVWIYQFNPDWSGFIAVESVAEGCISLIDIEGIEHHFQSNHYSLTHHRRTRVMGDIEVAGLSPKHLATLRSWQIRASLLVPIIQQGNLWGLLLANQCHAPRFWQELEINLFRRLSEQVALMIQQSELYHQLQKSNQELQRLAMSDGLTQVANRRCFDLMLKDEWQKLERKSYLSLILCDIDCFKLYNDTYGHLAGDEILKQIALELKQVTLDENALISRYGGEEFAIILPKKNLESAARIAQKIQDKITDLQLPHNASTVSKFITISMGISSHIPDFHLSSEVLIGEADNHLYQAKKQGKNAWVAGSENCVVNLIG